MANLPNEFKEKYQKLLGPQEANDLFKALAAESKKGFRINTLKKTMALTYSDAYPVSGLKHAFYGAVSGKDPEWVSGYVYSQDPAAMFPAAISPVKPGDKVLDLCAAPGGKTTALGEKLKGKGLLVANEISRVRAKTLRENIERWGITNCLLTNTNPARLAPDFKHFFDLVLVDAPCSGEGMFRKDPEAVSYWSQDYVLSCQSRQKKILPEAVKMLKPGGYLVYSTCTFSPEEDEEIVNWLVKKEHLQIKPIPVETKKIAFGRPAWGENNPDLTKTLRFWPQDGLGEGQFVALLQLPKLAKAAKNSNRPFIKHQQQNLFLTKNERLLINQVLKQFNLPAALIDWRKKARVQHQHVFVPALVLNQKLHLPVLNNGVELGILKKKRFEPGHQLAEVLGQVVQKRVIDLSQTDYRKYLHGETIKVNSDFKGFVLVSYHNLIFSFGKIAGKQILKNFYPKGLRY